jgi:hypothetical protein
MLREQLGKGAERAGLVRLARTLKPARAGKCQVSKQGAEYHRMLAFMSERLSTVRASMPNRQVSLQLLLDDLFLQGGQ